MKWICSDCGYPLEGTESRLCAGCRQEWGPPCDLCTPHRKCDMHSNRSAEENLSNLEDKTLLVSVTGVMPVNVNYDHACRCLRDRFDQHGIKAEWKWIQETVTSILNSALNK